MLGGCTATATPSFFLSSTPTYRVHPLVVFSVLDHYQRRNDGQTRVVGTLLGQQMENGVVEIKQAFPVPHQEEEESVSTQAGRGAGWRRMTQPGAGQSVLSAYTF